MPQVPGGENALRLQVTTTPDQSIWDESTTKKAPLGTEIVLGMRKFRYASAGTNLNAGDVLVTPSNTYCNKNTVNAAAAAGATAVNAYLAADQAANALQDGWVLTKDSAGQGYLYGIKSHGALTATTAGQSITLYDPLAASVTATSVMEIIVNPYSGVMSATGVTATSVFVGVAPIVVTSGNYFWAQVGGVAPVKAAGNLTYGSKAACATTGGALAIDATANATGYVGVVLSVTGTALDHVATWISPDPSP